MNRITKKIRQLNIKKMKTKFMIPALMVVAHSMSGQVTWSLDKAHTEIKFNVNHLVISEVGGKFKEFDGQVISTNEDFDGSTIEFTAMVGSISTDNGQRDNHLKSDDFFNAEKYPELKFNGQLVKVATGYELRGDMTIRDVTKPIVFEVRYNGTVTDPWGNTKAGFKITGTIDRFDYGLKWNTLMEVGGAVADNEVRITCNVELQKQPENGA